MKKQLSFPQGFWWGAASSGPQTEGQFDKVKYRLQEGCSVVEMECSALAACCRKRGAQFGQFLFTADSLANVHEYDERDFGKDSHEKALLLGLKIVKNFT